MGTRLEINSLNRKREGVWIEMEEGQTTTSRQAQLWSHHEDKIDAYVLNVK